MKKYRGFIIATVVVALVIGVLALVDMGARRLGEQEVARQVQSALDLDATPEITLGGWPFLVHAVTRSFPSAHATVDKLSVPYEDDSVTVTNIDVTATDIAPEGDGYVVSHAEGTAKLSYDELSQITGMTTTSGGDGKLKIDVTWNGLTATVTGSPLLNKDAQTVTVENAEITVAGISVPSSVSQQILNMAIKPISLKNDYFTVMSISTEDEGIDIAMSADDLQLPTSS